MCRRRTPPVQHQIHQLLGLGPAAAKRRRRFSGRAHLGISVGGSNSSSTSWKAHVPTMYWTGSLVNRLSINAENCACSDASRSRFVAIARVTEFRSDSPRAWTSSHSAEAWASGTLALCNAATASRRAVRTATDEAWRSNIARTRRIDAVVSRWIQGYSSHPPATAAVRVEASCSDESAALPQFLRELCAAAASSDCSRYV
mmetsp:Transcript_9520/g.29623  ORF Transcript_9520/g.29623 Transcript_9520/m.29623 type:complete len:201 (-) Transcript_9520:60-662(-)